MTGDKWLTSPLTDEEKELVERYHNVIYKVLRDMRLMGSVDDFYDVGALALMAAAKKYTQTPSLHKYSFAAVGYMTVKSAVGNELNCRNRFDFRCPMSLDALIGEDRSLYDTLAAPEPVPLSPRTRRAYRAVWRRLTKREKELMPMIAAGMTWTQTGCSSRGAYQGTLYRVRRRLAPMEETLFGGVKMENKLFQRKSAQQAAT